MKLFLEVILCVLLIPFILRVVWCIKPSLWFCRVMGWHKVKSPTGFYGLSLQAKCEVCNAELLMDSQGNWF